MSIMRKFKAPEKPQGVLAQYGPNWCAIRLYEDRVETPDGGIFPLTPELNATVDTAGAITSRVTATRLVLTGPFALAMKKKKDARELFLYIDSPQGQFVQPCKPSEAVAVRRFAAMITTRARSLAQLP